MPLRARIKLLNEIEESELHHAAHTAVAEEFMQPDLPPDRYVADTDNLNRDLKRLLEKFPAEERSAKEIEIRKALINYAPDHIDFTFELPMAELTIGPHINQIDAIIGDRIKTSDLVSVAGGVIDQIIEREMEKLLEEKRKRGGHDDSHGSHSH